ncbi:putative receptor-like protein 8 [Lycium ferocissimum]|uniref:putative receptor-like protein 8 n=1 Tax=Lycium ferocissimum TaxID=112874 RepID=UPI00281533B4|nr:putative receptor-like protein 8 [Lycium ferocissimum]
MARKEAKLSVTAAKTRGFEHLYAELEDKDKGLCNLRSLQELDISGNSLKGSIPPCISNLTSLRLLDLSENNLGGTIPSDVLRLKSLEYLSLSLNHFEGSIALSSFTNNSNLEVLELDSLNNELVVDTENAPWKPSFSAKSPTIIKLQNQCLLPASIGHIFPNLLYLNMSGNSFQGSIPHSIGNMSELWSLDLSSNNFTGELPERLVMGCNKLFALKLSHNNLQGQLFPKKWNLTRLGVLFLDNNLFSGQLLPGLVTSSSLGLLDLSDNAILGKLPDWIGEFSVLGSLSASRSSFKGPILENCGRSIGAVSDPNPGDPGETVDLFKDSFLETFVPSCVVAFLGVAAFIYFNSTCRMIFQFIEAKLLSSR